MALNYRPRKQTQQQKVQASIDINPGHYETTLGRNQSDVIIVQDKICGANGKELSGSQALKAERLQASHSTFLAAKMKGRHQRWQAGAAFAQEPARIDASAAAAGFWVHIGGG